MPKENQSSGGPAAVTSQNHLETLSFQTQSLDSDIQELVEVINILLQRIELLERKCQALPLRPRMEHCPNCGNRISGPNPNCPICGINLEGNFNG